MLKPINISCCITRLSLLAILLLVGLPDGIRAQNSQPFMLEQNKLSVNDGNSISSYEWKNGSLTLLTATNIATGKVYTYEKKSPSYMFSPDSVLQTSSRITTVAATSRTSAYKQLDLFTKYSAYEVKQSLRVYADCAGVEHRLALRGYNIPLYKTATENNAMIENPELLQSEIPYYHYMPFSNRHVTTKTVSFREATDHHTNPVKTIPELPYRKPQYYKGNVMLATDNANGNTQLIIKLSPVEHAQSAYYGFDFSTTFDGVKIHSPGIEKLHDADADTTWQEAYALYSVLFANNENDALHYYKNYELSVFKYNPATDNTLTMNTWGDRNKDSRVNEGFILKELDAAKRLGVTHYQIDDGWQQGLSQNSSQKAGILWDDWADDAWKVNAQRFPGGLKSVVTKAATLNIKMGLWFNPSKKNNYRLWQRDKNILTQLHRDHNISWIKIDGVEIGNKLAERRVADLLQQSSEATANQLQFNMDVTAGKRGGFFFLNRVGNIFLENRYTDWGNYYPHLTLRNVWLLSKYMPLQRIQIEWLNKWRNQKAYPKNDVLSPLHVPFDYQFAITMMGQPLAWMEATGLPEEAFAVTPLITTWQKHRSEMQSGVIHPVGQMPDGYSFPGFVSYTKDKIYILLFRENTERASNTYTLPLGKITNKPFVLLAGNGNAGLNKTGAIDAGFNAPFSFIFGYFKTK